MDASDFQRRLTVLCDLNGDRDEVYTAHVALRKAGLDAESDLVSALGDEARPPEARSRIAGVLADLRSSMAVPGLIACLDDPSAHLRWHAVRALERIGDGAAVPALSRIAQEDAGEIALKPGFTLKVRDAARAALDTLSDSDIR